MHQFGNDVSDEHYHQNPAMPGEEKRMVYNMHMATFWSHLLLHIRSQLQEVD